MSRQAFDMVTQMPALRSGLEEPRSMENLPGHISAGADSTKVLKSSVGFFLCTAILFYGDLFCPALYKDEGEDMDEDEDWSDETYAAVTSFFVSTRYVDYLDESQLEDAENRPFAQETEKDKAILANFLRCLQDHGGLQFDTTKLRFCWVRDYHPHYSISVCLLHALPF